MSKEEKFKSIIPDDKRSIRNIPIPDRRMKDFEEYETHYSPIHEQVADKKTARKARKEKEKENNEEKVEISRDAFEDDANEEIVGLGNTILTNEPALEAMGDSLEEDDSMGIATSPVSSSASAMSSAPIPPISDGIRKSSNSNAYSSLKNQALNKVSSMSVTKKIWYSLGILIVIVILWSAFPSSKVILSTELLKVPMEGQFEVVFDDIETVEIATSTNITVDASGSTKVERKAKATVVLYNNFSTSAQKLAVNTKLKTPEGLIYLIDRAVSIPGKTTKAGKTIPGSITVTAVAEKAGPQYNSGPKDLSIPGLGTGTTKFKQIYGRTKGAIAGGFVGTVPNVSAKTIQLAIDAEKDGLKAAAQALIVSAASAKEVVINPENVLYTFSNTQAQPSKDNKSASTTLKLVAKVAGIKNSTLLTQAMKIIGASNDAVTTYTLDKNQDALKLSVEDDSTFKAEGQAKISLNLNTESLKNILAEKEKRDAMSELQLIKGVSKAKIVISPFWKMSLPKASAIKVLVD